MKWYEGVYGMDNDKVKVAIIDSGIDRNINNLRDFVKYETAYKINEYGQVVENDDMSIKHQHGTAIALVIKQLCSNVEFYSMNIFDENLLSDGRVLLHSIEKAIELKPDIIHLSLGTQRVRYIIKLMKLIQKAHKNGIIIVSALNNDGTTSYPANLMGVVRVEGYSFRDYLDYHYSKGKFIAPFGLEFIDGKEELDFKKFVGNSMAAAYITGHLCEVIDKNRDMSREEIINYFRRSASNK